MTKHRNLVQSYIDCKGGASAAVAALNEELGTSHPVQRIYEWRGSKRAVPQPVEDCMLRACLPRVIRHYGGRPPLGHLIEDCVESLCPPRRYEPPSP